VYGRYIDNNVREADNTDELVAAPYDVDRTDGKREYCEDDNDNTSSKNTSVNTQTVTWR